MIKQCESSKYGKLEFTVAVELATNDTWLAERAFQTIVTDAASKIDASIKKSMSKADRSGFKREDVSKGQLELAMQAAQAEIGHGVELSDAREWQASPNAAKAKAATAALEWLLAHPGATPAEALKACGLA